MSAMKFGGLAGSMQSGKHGTDTSTPKDDVQCDVEPAEDPACSMNLTAMEEKRIWRRIDLRIIPIITVIYLLSFMDRGMYSQQNALYAFILCLCLGNIGASINAVTPSFSSFLNHPPRKRQTRWSHDPTPAHRRQVQHSFGE